MLDLSERVHVAKVQIGLHAGFSPTESMSSVFKELDYNMVVCSDVWWQNGHRKRHVKPAKAMVFLVVSFWQEVVSFLPPWETSLTQEIHIHTD